MLEAKRNLLESHEVVQKLVYITGPDAYYQAIGYLLTWSFIAYPLVRLYIVDDGEKSGQPEILAHYYEAEDPIHSRYTIGAVWDRQEKRFGFHS